MKKKSEAAEAIMKTIQRLQTTLGKTVKRYHADNAGEQHTAELTTSLQKQGTTITTTAPNSSQQNAFAERCFSTIFNATRAALASSGLPLTLWSVAALDAIDKGNYLPVKRNTGNSVPPNAQLYADQNPKHLLPFGQRGYIVDTTPHKPKLQPRAIPARYLRALTPAQYLVLLPAVNKTRLIRPSEFIVTTPETPPSLPASTSTTTAPETPIVAKQDRAEATVSPDDVDKQDRAEATVSAADTAVNLYEPPPQQAALHASATEQYPDPAGQAATGQSEHKKETRIKERRREHAHRALYALAALTPAVTPPPPAPPRSLSDIAGRPDERAWYDAWDAELNRHDTELRTWTYETPRDKDKPLPYVMTFRAKTNAYGGLERCKVRCAIRGDRMRPGVDFDEKRTASHMPSQAGRRLLLAAAAAKGHAVASYDVPGAYPRAPNDPNHMVTMVQPPRSDGTMAAPRKICVSDAPCRETRPQTRSGTNGEITG